MKFCILRFFPKGVVYTFPSTIANFFGRNLVTEGGVLVLREYDRQKRSSDVTGFIGLTTQSKIWGKRSSIGCL